MPTADLDSLGQFKLDGFMMRYSVFAPKFYNLCKSFGMDTGKIMPSRAFCSDESQGFPVIMLTKHFGAFPFNHGIVGGIMATDRHGPHADHGRDVVVLQASHVGYDPESGNFGIYRRLQTENQQFQDNCGKILHVLNWYQYQYRFAQENVLLSRRGDDCLVTIDNNLLDVDRDEGLFLQLDKLLEHSDIGQYEPVEIHSTSRVYKANSDFVARADASVWGSGKGNPINTELGADLFYFKRDISSEVEGQQYLEHSLLPYQPTIVTSKAPSLRAAQITSQLEFDRAFRTLHEAPGYHGKKLVYLSGINIDISPEPGQVFPLTKFVPWAMYYQDEDGSTRIFEQEELFDQLNAQSEENPDEIDLEAAIRQMGEAEEIRLKL